MSEKIGFVKVIGCGISFIGMLVIITSGQINTLTSFTLNPRFLDFCFYDELGNLYNIP